MIIVNWKKDAKGFSVTSLKDFLNPHYYLKAAKNTVEVGNEISKLLERLSVKSVSKTHCIAFWIY